MRKGGRPIGRTKMCREDRRRAILDAATTVFARHGFHGARMEDVAQEAGVNIALLYQHFPGKEAVFEAILEQAYTDHALLPCLEEAAARADDREVFLRYARHYFDSLSADRDLHRVFLFAALEHPDLYALHFERKEIHPVGYLAGYIARRIAAGAMRAVDPQLAARAFASTVYFYALESRVLGSPKWSPWSAGDVLGGIVTMTLQGLLPERADPSSDRLAPGAQEPH